MAADVPCMDAIHDLLIVGGGLVGCSLAAALAAQGRRVALVEAVPSRAEPPAWDERCIALNAGSRRILESMDLWTALAPQAEPILSTHISERGRFGATRFTREQAGLPALGYNTPLRAIDEVLWSRVRQSAVHVMRPARVAGIEVLGDRVRVHVEQTEGSQTLDTRLVVAADGARSAIRSHLSLGAESRDYAQSALVTAIRPRYPHGGVAYERFLPTGPLAILPKSRDAQGHACSLVWTLPTDEARTFETLDESTFLSRAMEAFGERLGPFLALGRRQSYPLSRVMSAAVRAPRTLFIGNAAQSLHPVAAQGFNLGLRDAATLASLLRDHPGDPGEDALLQRYEAERASDRDRVSQFTDGLVRLFSNTTPGLRQLRHLGLLALELDTPVRDAVLRQNLGLHSAAGSQ